MSEYSRIAVYPAPMPTFAVTVHWFESREDVRGTNSMASRERKRPEGSGRLRALSCC